MNDFWLYVFAVSFPVTLVIVGYLIDNIDDGPHPDYRHISYMEHELGFLPCSISSTCSKCKEAAMMTGAWGKEGYEWHTNSLSRLAFDKQVESALSRDFYLAYGIPSYRIDDFRRG